MVSAVLFHITTRDAWRHALEIGRYAPASLAAEGFIHLSTEAQWPRTRERWFRDARDLVLLVIDPDRAGVVRYEPADGDVFPHLYNALDVAAVVGVQEL
jgi:uncharacterized protein (DUF952 family)